LALEIAESALMENAESAIAVLNQLRELGVELYMSHFGSGRLSLSSMPSFPLQGIKVDSVVVHRVGGRRVDLDVVRSIMDLARSLGLRVIAEGVETVAQRERLIAFGCELGQGGHLLARPLEPKAAIALLKVQHQTDKPGQTKPGTLTLSQPKGTQDGSRRSRRRR
jgi:EAL domain-containing protein (putative c-di-GMP-specific phosphodiesterase class I)